MRKLTTALLILSLSACGGSGGDDDEPDTVVVAPTPAPIPDQCTGNTGTCEQADSTVQEAAEHGVENISFSEDESEEIPGLNQDGALRECVIVICSTGVNIGNTTTTTNTTTNLANRWAGVTSIEVIR